MKLQLTGYANTEHVPDESKHLTRFMGNGIKRMRPIFKSDISLCQSKANLDIKTLFGKIPHLLLPEIR